MTRKPSAETLARMAAAVGEKGVLRGADDQAPYLKEWRGLWTGETPLILRPQNTVEVSSILRIANETGTAMVPQSGNTGLVGGQIPRGGEVLLSLDRMTKIIDVDPANATMTVQAGATLRAVQLAAENGGQLFPLSIASEGTARIGGVLSTNAGGVNVLSYGNARDLCLGLEVVLADGRILNTLKSLRKDNTGYDLKQLFIGSEGTLGVITAATLKLFPKPKRYDTIFAAIESPERAVELFSLAKDKFGSRLTSCELLPEIGVQFTAKHMHTRRVLETVTPWYVLLEVSDGSIGEAESLLEAAFERSVVADATLAQNEMQRGTLWALRENLSESQRFEGGSIKHDVSVPVSKLTTFIAAASQAAEQFQPGVRICCFGHLGDGNMHFNVSQPIGMDKQAYLDRWHEMNRVVHDIAHRLGGSFSAEHGIGVLKREDMRRYKSTEELDVMRALKSALDPKGILNPGRVLP
jgi:FAD/FMN-containing dehydrogenase